MNKIFVSVGIPGSGKSSWAEANKEKLNMVVLSSDKIREELGDINDQSKNTLVFELLHKRIKEDLLAGKNVFMDCTNLSRKRRIAFLNEIKNIPCEKICVLFATPWEICLSNNFARERQVPEDVMCRMLKQFETPFYFEGWDDIQIVYWDYSGLPGFEYDYMTALEKMRIIDHNNPHHTNTIGDHMIEAYQNMCNKTYDPCLRATALMHDCGKPWVKAFIDGKGNPSEVAHYYGHEHVSSYLSLFYARPMHLYSNKYMPYSNFTDNDILLISTLVDLHMRPFTWEKSEKAKEKDKKLFGDIFFNWLEMLHEADLAAH